MPNRVSFPSMAPPAASKAGPRPANSVHIINVVNASQMTAIAPRTAYPCRSEPAMRPKARVMEKGMRRMRKISKRLEKGVGFSKGWAALALKYPPPLVPSSLIASCEATAPPFHCWASPENWPTA